MYQPEDEKKLLTETRAWLKRLQEHALPQDQAEADSLRAIIRYHEYRYYINSAPVVADAEYDALFAALKETETQHPDWVTEDSPTQRVSIGLTKAFPTVYHLVPMLSLENSYDADDLKLWDERVRGLVKGQDVQYTVEPKYDGAGISLVYENDKLVRGATRGDGSKGEEITTNIKQLRSIPLSAAFSKHGIHRIEIRGEVLINKNVFKQVNEQRVAQALPPFANPRNAASGGLRMQDPKEVAARRMEAFLYHVSVAEDKEGNNLLLNDDASHYGFIQLLHRLGFVTPIKDVSLCNTIDEVIVACNVFDVKRNDYPFEMDGLVVKVSSLRQQQLCGYTSHHPRWAMAYKFKAQQGTSKLVNVEFQVGRTGNVTPVAKIEPVQLAGVTVTSVSMFNEDFIRDKDIRLGDTVLVERAGDVIPYIVMPIVEARDGSEQSISFPKNCPSCGSPLEKLEDEAATRCVNIACPAQVLERLVHFVSKDAMNVKGFSIASINEFLQRGLITNVPSIYGLDYDKILQLEGWKEKSVNNLKTSIESSKTQPLHRLIFGLGIRMVGETTAKKIAERVKDIFELKDWSVEQLLQIEDVGPKVAQSIFDFFDNDDNLAILERLKNLGVNTINDQPVKTEGPLSGKTFLFTGTLNMKRSDAEEMVERLGGKILGGVSAKLNYLVAGEDAGSKLDKAKKIGTVEIIDEKTFLEIVDAGT